MMCVTCQCCSDSKPTRLTPSTQAGDVNQPRVVEQRPDHHSIPPGTETRQVIHMSQPLDTLWDVPPLRAVICSASNHLLVAGTSAHFSLFRDGASPGGHNGTFGNRNTDNVCFTHVTSCAAVEAAPNSFVMGFQMWKNGSVCNKATVRGNKIKYGHNSPICYATNVLVVVGKYVCYSVSTKIRIE